MGSDDRTAGSEAPAARRPEGGEALPRRALLGLELVTRADGAPGLEVRRVLPASTADALGVRPGDRVLAICGQPLTGRDALLRAVHGLRAGARVSLSLRRAGAGEETVEGSARPLPRERVPGSDVLLAHVHARGERQRLIYTRPRRGLPGQESRFPAILFLQGLASASCEAPLGGGGPLARLIAGWAAAGFVTLRVEKPGLGDSEGPDPSRVDFARELAGFRAGLEHLRARDFVDPARVLLFGHSLGGMVAPLLAREHPVRGVAVYGASARPWLECELASYRRQRGDAGASASELARRMPEVESLLRAVYREGRTPAQLYRERPALRVIGGASFTSDRAHGRPLEFFRQLDRAELAAAWSELDARVVAYHGARDRVCGADEAAEIVAIVNRAKPGRARYVELPGLDHVGALTPATGDASARAQGDDPLLLASRAWFSRVCEAWD